MDKIIRKTATPIGALVLAVLFLVISAVIVISNVTHATNNNSDQVGRLITVHDRGEKKVFLTQSATVADALKEAGIVIDSKDAVEPALDEKLIASDYQVNIYRARPVIIVDGNVRTKVNTPYQTAPQIAQNAGIILYDEDIVTLGRTDDIVSDGAGLELTIKRAIKFNFTLYGKTSVIRTQGMTVADMLREKSIGLKEKDMVRPSLDTAITTDMTVRVWREGKQTITVEEPIQFEVEIVEDVDREVGYRTIKTAGSVGSRNVTYEIIIQDDKEVSRNEINSLTTKQPETQIEVVGMKGKYTTPSERENIIWGFLRSQGFSNVQTAGIMGNLKQERVNFETTDVPGGLGIAQWIGGRRANLIAMYPDSYTNIYSQLNYMMHELNGSYSRYRDMIKAESSLTEVVRIFQNHFEVCGVCRESQRILYAQNILASHE